MEFQFYHSIHARGEDVEEVLRQAELDEINGGEKLEIDGVESDRVKSKRPAILAERDLQEEMEDGEVDEDESALQGSAATHDVIGPQLPTVQPSEMCISWPRCSLFI